MSATVTLTVTRGMLVDREWVLEGPARFVVGRAEGCDVRLPADRLHQDVSRRHCVIEVEGEDCWVRDLGSRNGTFVNEVNVGQRSDDGASGDADPDSFLAHRLRDGDEVRVGFTVFRVAVAGKVESADLGRVSVPVG
jgi:pSer/pThr/pTyr-binding forkhead associated (FHA) protein